MNPLAMSWGIFKRVIGGVLVTVFKYRVEDEDEEYYGWMSNRAVSGKHDTAADALKDAKSVYERNG